MATSHSPATSDTSAGSTPATASFHIHGIAGLLIGVFLVAIVAVQWQRLRLMNTLIESAATQAAKDHLATLATIRTVYTEEVVSVAVKHGIEITHDYKKDGHSIPLPATLTMLIGNRMGAADSEARTRLYSPYPFKWREAEGGLRDEFQREAWEKLNADPETPFSRIVNGKSGRGLRYAISDRMRSSCVQCHNEHPDSPRRGWKVGDVRGILEVELPLREIEAQVRRNLLESTALMVLLAMAGGAIVWRVIFRLHRLTTERDLRVQELHTINAALDQTVEERTSLLRASEERLELAVRGSTDGLWDWNVLTSEVYYSPRMKELLGHTDDEMPNVFESFESRLHPDDHDGILDELNAHLQHRKPYDVEYRLRTKSGEYRWFRARGQAVWNEAGQPQRMAGSITDITRRKQAEDALQKMRISVDRAGDSIFWISRQGRILYVNDATCADRGYSREELLGMTIFDLDPDYQPGVWDPHFEDLKRRGTITLETRHRTKDGRVFPVEVNANYVFHNGEELNFAFLRDITERKRAEEELRRAKEAAEEASRILDSSLKSIADGVIIADSTGKFLFWNEVAKQIIGLGTTDSPIEGWTAHYGCFLPDMVTPYPSQDLPLARTVRGEDVHEDELFIRNSQKPEGVWLSVNGRPLRDETNQLRGGVVVFRDTTERRRHEEELHRAKEAAETANKAKSSFLANMSHEIRTPMNGIIGMTQLLARTELRSHQRDYLTTVDESAHILLRLLNDILDFSKIEAGKLELERVNFRISECVGRASQMLVLRAAEKGLEIACRIAPEIPDHLLGDSGRIQQVLVNLLGNAVKFTEAGEIFVNLNAESITSELARLHFSVSDTGIGIPADKQVQIFRPFEQAESSTTRRFGGTGLGLAISRQLVEMMHGKMWVESEPGRGSTFHFTAELEISDDQHRHEPAELESLLDLPVLVVDDNFTNRRILSEMLQYWHMQPVLADSAAAARRALQTADESQHPIRLILLDHHMPGEDGLHFAESLRDIRNQGQCPIIMISSGTSPIDAELGQKYGIGRFMTKPVIASELLNEVLRQFGRYTTVKLVQPPTPVTSPPVHPRRVLLVEDNEINRRVALGLLRSRGHQVVVAVNGLEAVNTLAAEEFDVVLMDMQMPVMDGYEATAEIRKREHQTGGHIPIVAMTAEALKGDRERCLAVGMDDYVSKPIAPAEMYRAVERFPALCLPVDVGLREASESVTTSAADRDVAPLERRARSDNSAPDALPAIDWNVAKERLGGGTDTLREFAELAKKETATQLAEILRAIETRDFKLLRRAAHTLKGSVTYFGAEPLVQVALDLENHGRNESWDGCAELLPTLESELARFLTVLDAGPPEASDGT